MKKRRITKGGGVIKKTYEMVQEWEGHAGHVVKSLLVVPHPKGGQFIWSASPSERSIKVWNTSDYSLKTIVQNKEHAVYCLEKHGDYVWAGGNGEIFLYKSDSFSMRGSWRVHDSSISSLMSFGNRIWSGAATGEMKIWEDKVYN